jgi:formylmethanofuran dehydrogenase subunit E
MNIRQLITDLRGGIPEKCDACGKSTPPEDLDPVSGGEWICNECMEAELKYLNNPRGEKQ